MRDAASSRCRCLTRIWPLLWPSRTTLFTFWMPVNLPIWSNNYNSMSKLTTGNFNGDICTKSKFRGFSAFSQSFNNVNCGVIKNAFAQKTRALFRAAAQTRRVFGGFITTTTEGQCDSYRPLRFQPPEK